MPPGGGVWVNRPAITEDRVPGRERGLGARPSKRLDAAVAEEDLTVLPMVFAKALAEHYQAVVRIDH